MFTIKVYCSQRIVDFGAQMLCPSVPMFTVVMCYFDFQFACYKYVLNMLGDNFLIFY